MMNIGGGIKSQNVSDGFIDEDKTIEKHLRGDLSCLIKNICIL